MSNAETDRIVGFSRNEIFVLRMIGVKFVAERPIGALRESTLLVDQRDEIHRFHRDQIENPLIIFEGDVLPVDVLVVVFFLFEFENVMNEELLQILVRIIDAQLFETVVLKILKTENIQNAETFSIGVRFFRFVNRRVDFLHDPNEHFPVNSFDERIAKRSKLRRVFSLLPNVRRSPNVKRLFLTQRRDDRFSMSENRSFRQSIE